MKALLKTLVRSGVQRLTWHQRDLLIRTLARDYGEHDLLVRMAREAGIARFMADGDCGAIQSGLEDRRILLEYGRAGTWAPHTVAALRAFFAPTGGTYLDIGANIGLTTIPIAHNPAVRCIAFEPDPENFANLADNLRRALPGRPVETHRLALMDRAGEVTFAQSRHGNLGDHRVSVAPEPGAVTLTVPAARLDDVVGETDGPLGLKLDAQGAEPFILAGGRRVLARCGLAVVEFSPMLIDQLGGDPEVVVDFLAGFERFEVARDDTGQAPAAMPAAELPAHLRAVFARGRTNDRDYLDVYAWRREAPVA